VDSFLRQLTAVISWTHVIIAGLKSWYTPKNAMPLWWQYSKTFSGRLWGGKQGPARPHQGASPKVKVFFLFGETPTFREKHLFKKHPELSLTENYKHSW